MLELKPERFGLRDFDNQPIAVCGKAFIGDQSGALYWPSERTLIVADLHLEKASSFAAHDTRETLLNLARAIDRYQAEAVIALGNNLHDPDAAERISPDDLDILRLIQEDRGWVWINGNHDPDVAPVLGGHSVDEIVVEGIRLVHRPGPGRVTHEIAAHLHPAARLSMHGHTIRRPCFVGNGRRLVLPAFGALTGGLNVLDQTFLPVFGHDGFAVWMLGDEGLYPVATRQLCGD